MKNLNMKRSKRLTGMVCMMLSIFLLTMPLLGMAAAQDVSGNDAPACICDMKCSVETPNQECPVCKENADACKGQAAEPNTLPCFCEKKCTKDDHNTECPACAGDMDLCTAPPAGEPAACICTVLCQEDAVNPDCVSASLTGHSASGKHRIRPRSRNSLRSQIRLRNRIRPRSRSSLPNRKNAPVLINVPLVRSIQDA